MIKIHDIINQFNNVRKYLFDEKRKLYVHAYDEAHYMQWANKEDGKAPNVSKLTALNSDDDGSV